MCDIKVKKTKNFIVFMEKNLTRDGVQFKCTISVKPQSKRAIAPRRVQVQTVPAKDFKGYKELLHSMLKNKSKELQKYLCGV